MDLKGFHHMYLGLLMVLAGFLVLIYKQDKIWSALLAGGGLWLVLDDWFQHWKQITEPAYRSFLHRMYGKLLYRFTWICKLNELADRIFGKGRG